MYWFSQTIDQYTLQRLTTAQNPHTGERTKKPLEMSKECARDLCLGLCCNFNNAIVVEMFYELETQPYRYDAFEIEFKEKECAINE